MSERIRRFRRKCLALSYVVMTTLLQLSPLCVCASGSQDKQNQIQAKGADAVTGTMGGLFNIVAALIQSFGSILVLWGIFEFGTSMQSPNGSEQTMAFKRISGGLLMTIGPALYLGLVS